MHAFPRTAVILLAALGLVSACAPAQPTPSAADIQVQVAAAVAMTVAAQGALTAAAQPAATETPTPTEADIPTLTPILPTVTPFTFVSPASGGGGGSALTPPAYGCVFTELKPTTNVFKPGNAFDILWLIKNTGSKTWPSNKQLSFVSGTHFTTTTSVTLPPLKYGETTSVSFDANAPVQPGFYEMKWKVEGGLCFPFTDIEVGKPKDP